jgi:tetratricopeptide (TPR) repeat protein
MIRGTIYAAKGEMGMALTYLRESIALDPKWPDSHGARGAVWSLTGRFDLALTDLNEALRLDPENLPALTFRSAVLFAKKEHAKAAGDLEAALRIDPTNSELLSKRGFIWQDAKDWPRALAGYDAALAVDPNQLHCLVCRSIIRSSCPDPKYRDTKKALEDAQRVNELTGGKNVASLGALAMAHAESGQFDDAAKVQKQVIELLQVEGGGSVSGARELLTLFEQKKPYRLPEK